MSHRTVLIRWRRYQTARLDDLIECLAREARRFPTKRREDDVRRLGAAMRTALQDYCDDISVGIEERVSHGVLLTMPDLAFERL